MIEDNKKESADVKVVPQKSKRRYNAFDLAEDVLKVYNIQKIEGQLYLLDRQKMSYIPLTKNILKEAILLGFYQNLKEYGSVSIVDKCISILLSMTYPSCPAADSNGYLAFQDGYLSLNSLTPLTFSTSLIMSPDEGYPTYRINAFGQNLTYYLQVQYPTPVMDGLISRISQGNPAIASRIWEILGYLIVPDNAAKAWFLFQGVPNAGKSVLGNFIVNLFPDSRVQNLDIDQLGAKTATKSLENKNINFSADLPNKKLPALAVRNIKLITGNDYIATENSSGAFKRAQSRCKFLFASNHPLTLVGHDAGFEDRIVCIRFRQSVDRSRLDPLLPEKLLVERDAIVAKALSHYVQLRNRNYVFSGSDLKECQPQIRYLTPASEDSDNGISAFVDEMCILSPKPEAKTYTSVLFDAYKSFCAKNQLTPVNDIAAFSRKLKRYCADDIQKSRWREGLENQNGFLGIKLALIFDDLIR